MGWAVKPSKNIEHYIGAQQDREKQQHMEIKHDKAATIVIVELCFVLRSVRRVVLSHVQKHGMIDDDDDDDNDSNNTGPHCFDSSSICKAMFHQDGFFHPSD